MNDLRTDFATRTLTGRQPRTDLRTRDLIDRAVKSVPAQGLAQAAAFLATMGVPAEVAVRALVYPDRRRAC